MLRLPDDWIWDNWIADDGALFHLFFKGATRNDDGQLAHARSADMRTWGGTAYLRAAGFGQI